MYTLYFAQAAMEELRKEAQYSKSRWGSAHAKKYMATLERKIRALCHNPHLYKSQDALFSGLRLMSYKGNHVFFWIDEQEKRIIILGVPSIYRELAAETLKQRLSPL